MKINFELKDLVGAVLLFLMGLINFVFTNFSSLTWDAALAIFWTIAASAYFYYTWRAYKRSK